jgi:AraC-like DNA-binding protein
VPDASVTFELILRGIAIGALAATAIGIWRVAARKPTGLAGLLLCLTALAHVMENSAALRAQLGPALTAINFFSMGGTGFVWLFVVTLFEDRPLEPRTLAPAVVLTLLGLLAAGGASGPAWFVHKLAEAGIAIHALSIVVRTWRGDLVEARAQFRMPFLAIVALYVPLLVGLHIGASLGLRLPLRDLINAVALAAIGLAGAAIFLRAPADLLGAIKAPIPPAPESGDQVALDRLTRAMDVDEIWRREGLTIGALAEAVGVPEHRLRPLINGHLGFRNFASFVNARRIEAAKTLLVDPEKSRVTIATIAFDLGFGSLGPFNRAFKEATGVTPTEYRRARPSPNPENPR